MHERTIGILGGMGPEATADLFMEIIRLTPAKRDQDHIPVLIYSNSKIPERTAAILGRGEDPLPLLIHSAQVLQEAGAGIIAVPCNTAHYYLQAVAAEVQIPVLDMIRETKIQIRNLLPEAKKVGLLASLGTVSSRIYHRVFEEDGIEITVPDPSGQERVTRGINEVKASAHGVETRRMFRSEADRMVAGGAGAVILGCTEIPLSFDKENADYPCLNPTRILAQASVDWALGKKQYSLPLDVSVR